MKVRVNHMSLLEDIQNAAVDSNTDLGTVLRKCKVLAARLNSKPLDDWLVWESNGYPKHVVLPDYRVWHVELKGHFSGPFGSGMRNAPIPRMCLPEEFREDLTTFHCRHSIVGIQELVKALKGGTFHTNVGDLAAILGTTVYCDLNCIQAWGEFGVARFIEILNTVRNRILDFLLAVWKEDPKAGEVHANSEKLPPNQVTQIFNMTVYGGAANVVGTAQDSSITFEIALNDFGALQKLLNANGVSEEDIAELKAALGKDPGPENSKGYGPQVAAWVAKMVQKAASGVWKVGIGAAGTLLANAISRYYGLAP